MGIRMRMYWFDIPSKRPMFGRVLARNLRLARGLLRAIMKRRMLPRRSQVWLHKM
jgi:hypothetical protein